MLDRNFQPVRVERVEEHTAAFGDLFDFRGGCGEGQLSAGAVAAHCGGGRLTVRYFEYAAQRGEGAKCGRHRGQANLYVPRLPFQIVTALLTNS